MKTYEKPLVIANEELAEGVYAASGAVVNDPAILQTSGTTGNGDIKCDSIYMNGVWQKGDNSQWAGCARGYKEQFGCIGCSANTDSACGLKTHYVESDYAESYNTDNGSRKPSWEKKGYGPNDVVSDWNM